MKYRILLLMAFLSLGAFAQKGMDTNVLNNSNNIYLYSLKEYCKSLNYDKTKIVYVQWDDSVVTGSFWPTEINGYTIKYLRKVKDYKNEIKKNSGKITVVGIRSLSFKDNKFYVTVIPFDVTYQKRILNFSNGGGWKFYFNHDVAQETLTFVGYTSSGI